MTYEELHLRVVNAVGNESQSFRSRPSRLPRWNEHSGEFVFGPFPFQLLHGNIIHSGHPGATMQKYDSGCGDERETNYHADRRL
jgi:hypothetical protein